VSKGLCVLLRKTAGVAYGVVCNPPPPFTPFTSKGKVHDHGSWTKALAAFTANQSFKVALPGWLHC